MTVIWKFPIDLYRDRMVTASPVVEMPAGARMLTMQLQAHQPTLWAIVDPAAPKEPRQLHIVGTGHPMPAGDLVYLGTWQSNGLVFHVFEEAEREAAGR